MSLIDLKDVTFNYDGTALLETITARLLPGEHVVLLGPNGTGKSTLVRLLMHQLTPDSGLITFHPHKVFKALDQHLVLPKDETVIHYLSGVYQEFFDLEKRMHQLYDEAARADADIQLKKISQASRIQETLNDSQFYQYQTEILKVITGLGLEASVLEQTIGTLSGGMRSKVKLSEILLSNADIMLLDEPSNFLDEGQVDWLLKYLKRLPNAFIVVTHESRIAEEIATTIWALEQKSIQVYRGDYSFYLKERTLRAEQHQKAFKAQQKYIAKTEEFIAKNIARAKTTRRAQSRRKQLAKLERIDPLEKAKAYDFSFPMAAPTGEKVCVINDLSIGYDSALVEPITLTIRRGEKWAITGENGVGKTTLIRTIMNQHSALEGLVTWIDTAQVNYFSQDHHLDPALNPYQIVQSHFPEYDRKKVYATLARFGIRNDKALRPIKTLSGGEQSKVRLALLWPVKSNVFILDEPTNHLDVAIKEALKEALIAYEGTLILVSHERDFYEDICPIELQLEKASL